jgi:hypothetical protein
MHILLAVARLLQVPYLTSKYNLGGKNMPFCPNCGAKLSEDSKFCPTCGTQVTFTEPVDKNTENVQEEKIPIVNDNKNDEVDAESTNTKMNSSESSNRRSSPL